VTETLDYAELSLGAGEPNEDALGHWRRDGTLVFAIADGVTDRRAGHVASVLAVEVLGSELLAAPGAWPLEKRLRRAVQAANVAVYQKGVTVPELRRMATTLTVTAVEGRRLVAAHVGDCRLLLSRAGRLTQLTKDHTRAWDDPHAPLDVSRNGRRRMAPSRSLGHELVVAVDVLRMELVPGDRLLQCSDGVHGALAEGELQELLDAHPLRVACHAIVRRAHERDTGGDASAQAVGIGALPPPPRPWWRLGL
jgi:protein phosphatase